MPDAAAEPVAEAVEPVVQDAAVVIDPEPLPDLTGARSLFHAIHIASYRGEETARSGWQTLSAMFPEALDGLEPRVEGVDIPDQGFFLRLKAGPFNSAREADAACDPFRAAGVWCVPVDFTGETLAVTGE